ncbi:MAG: hypothetical protein ACJ72W_03675 [Actinoallomurus sp.]
MRIRSVAATVVGAGALVASAFAPTADVAVQAGGGMAPQAVHVPMSPDLVTTTKQASTACTLPNGGNVSYYHCYTPQQIRSAYGVSGIPSISVGGKTVPNYGQGQTIVLVDSYGSPTAAADLQRFHDTFFPNLPDPDFTQKFPQGNPQYKNSNGQGLSGSSGAAGWSGEATLVIDWAYAVAPEAHIVLVAVPPAETLGVQGFPNLFKAISDEIDDEPAGTVFSMSFGVSEETFAGAAATQTAKFDEVFKKGLAKHDNFFASSGDDGTSGTAKQQHEGATYPQPTVGWPASSPYVVSVGGTQLQYGWTWDPSDNAPRTSTGARNPDYWKWTDGGKSEAAWNESFGPIGTGGGASSVYSRPDWQKNVATRYGDHRLVPDTSWNAAVNGGVEVYISAYPDNNCGNSTGCWTIYGGTSAASPQTAALVALVNAARGSAGKQPIGFLDPILYSGLGSTAYTDIVPQHYGDAPKGFDGSDVGVDGTVSKSAGDIVDNQMWGVSTAGYPTTTGYDLTTGWGVPKGTAFVPALTALP